MARGPRGERMIAGRPLLPRAAHTALAADELITAVRFPLPPAGAGSAFAEVARRHGDFALVGVGGT